MPTFTNQRRNSGAPLPDFCAEKAFVPLRPCMRDRLSDASSADPMGLKLSAERFDVTLHRVVQWVRDQHYESCEGVSILLIRCKWVSVSLICCNGNIAGRADAYCRDVA